MPKSPALRSGLPSDLTDFFYHEFDLPGRKPWPEEMRPIRFWASFLGS